MTVQGSTSGVAPMGGAARAYIVGVGVLAVGLCAMSWALFGPPRDVPGLVALLALTLLNRPGWPSEIDRGVGFNVASLIPVAAFLVLGPTAAGIVGALAHLASAWRVPVRALAFNSAMYSVMGSLAGFTYLAMGGHVLLADVHGAKDLFAHGLVPLFVAEIVLVLVNALILCGIMVLSRHEPFRALFVSLVSSTGMPYLVTGGIALLLGVLWGPVGLDWVSTALVVVPVLTARWAFARYSDEREAKERTVAALLGAVETKSPGSTGQGARVGRLAAWVAEELPLGPDDIEAVRVAGALHDLGLLAVPTALLDPDRPVLPDEAALLRAHPTSAVRMLAGVTAFEGSLPAIAHHHERLDGTGYPDGLAGDDIPLGARVVAVADAFQALMTPRRERPALAVGQALARIDTLSGTAYDPVVVAALARALDRHPEAGDAGPTLPAALASAIAHDEPAAAEVAS